MSCVSIRRQISTPCWPRKWSSSNLLPWTPSAFQHASRRDPPYVRLDRAAILGYEEDHGFQDSSNSGCSSGKAGEGCEKPAIQLHTRIIQEIIEEIGDFLEGWLVGCDGLGGLSRALGSGGFLFGGSFRDPLRGLCGSGRRLFGFGPLHRTDRVFSVGGSLTGSGTGLGRGVSIALTTRSPWTTWFHPLPRLSCSADGAVRDAFVAAGWPAADPDWTALAGDRFPRAALASFHFAQPRYLAVWFPLQPKHLSCSLGGRAATGCVSFATGHTPGSVPALTLGMTKSLAALTLHRGFWCHVCLDRNSQSSELGEGAQLCNLGSSWHWHNEVGVWERPFLPSWERLPDRSCIAPWSLLPRAPTSFWTTLSGMDLSTFFTRSPIVRFSRSEKLWKDTPLPPSRDLSAAILAWNPWAVFGTMIRRSALVWAMRPPRHAARIQARKPRMSLTSETKPGSCRLTFPQGRRWTLGRWGSGASWHAAQWAGQIRGLAPMCCFNRSSGLRVYWVIGCGLERPTRLLWDSTPGNNRGLRQPSLGRAELPAAVSSLFSRGRCRPTRRGRFGRWMARSWFRRGIQGRLSLPWYALSVRVQLVLWPCWSRRSCSSLRRHGLPQFLEYGWRQLYRGNILQKG
jgi:hypothetical protein